MMRLIGQHGTERPVVGWEASIAPVDVIAISNGCSDRLIGVAWDASLNGRAVAPGSGRPPIAEGSNAHSELVIDIGQHGSFHVLVVRRAEWLDQRHAVALEADSGWD